MASLKPALQQNAPVLRRLTLDHAPLPDAMPATARVAAGVAYFDAILSLIPARIYFGPDDDEKEAGWMKYARNKANAAPEQLRKEGSKAAKKRMRFDPDAEASASTTVPGMLAAREADGRAKNAAVMARAGARAGGRIDEDEGDDEDEEMEDGGSKPAAGRRNGGAAADGSKVSGHYGDLAEDADEGGAGSKRKRHEGGGPGVEYRPGADREELMERLKARIASLKAAREGDPTKQDRKALKAPDTLVSVDGKPKEKEAGQRKASGKDKGKDGKSKVGKGKDGKVKPTAKPAPSHGQAAVPVISAAFAAARVAADVGSNDFAFGAISTALPASLAAATISTKPALPGHGGGKEGKIRNLLADAKKYQKRLEALKASGDTGGKLSLEFGHAIRRAEGERVRDDPHLLAKSLKRVHADKAASADAWKERGSKAAAETADRQASRNENLKGKRSRALKRADRPEPEKTGRDNRGAGGGGAGQEQGGGQGQGGGGGAAPKKAANRPGFEGRKKGFID